MKIKSLQESIGAIEANIEMGQSVAEFIDQPDHNITRIKAHFARIQELLEELEENSKK